jgi:hypothetical protein
VLIKLDTTSLWKKWSFIDKFSFLVCTLASAAPLINHHNSSSTGDSTQDSVVLIIRILRQITGLLDTERKSLDDDDEIHPAFKKKSPKINQEDDEDSYKEESNHSESEKEEPVSPTKRKRVHFSKSNLEPPKKKSRLSLNKKENGDEGPKS